MTMDLKNIMSAVNGVSEVEGVCNAISLQMVPKNSTTFLWGGVRLTTEEAASLVKRGEVTSYIGHPDTAAVVSGLLGKEVPCNRTFATLPPGQALLIAQVEGGRLPAGCTELPEGIRIVFWKVTAF